MGTMTDVLGPRYSAAIALLLTAPLMFGIALIETAAGFIALRMLVGLGLSMFVVGQKWMSVMFNRQVLGRATALSAGEPALQAFRLLGLSDCMGQPHTEVA